MSESLKEQVIEAMRNCEENGYPLDDIDDLAGELIDYAGFDVSYNEMQKVLLSIDSTEANIGKMVNALDTAKRSDDA